METLDNRVCSKHINLGGRGALSNASSPSFCLCKTLCGFFDTELFRDTKDKNNTIGRHCMPKFEGTTFKHISLSYNSLVTGKFGQGKIGYITVILWTPVKFVFYLFYVIYLFYEFTYFAYFYGYFM